MFQVALTRVQNGYLLQTPAPQAPGAPPSAPVGFVYPDLESIITHLRNLFGQVEQAVAAQDKAMEKALAEAVAETEKATKKD